MHYKGYARAINPNVRPDKPWSWRTSSPGLLVHAVKQYGWRFIPEQVLPPMMANVTVGAILYTTYLQSLSAIYEPAARGSSRIYPPPPVTATFTAGMIAGSVQSLAAAPLDALQIRFRTSEMLEGRYHNMVQYAGQKLKEIGPRGVFAGWSLSLTKDAIGYGMFFASFETVKSQAFYHFVTRYYGKFKPYLSEHDTFWIDQHTKRPTIKPHFAMEPTFILLAGIAASISQQFIQHPIQRIQDVHYERLESLDYAAKLEKPRERMLALYYKAYQKTMGQCEVLAARDGGWRAWLYKDLLRSTLRQVPSTSAGLIVFELIRRRYATDADIVRIKKDGYDILLS